MLTVCLAQVHSPSSHDRVGIWTLVSQILGQHSTLHHICLTCNLVRLEQATNFHASNIWIITTIPNCGQTWFWLLFRLKKELPIPQQHDAPRDAIYTQGFHRFSQQPTARLHCLPIMVHLLFKALHQLWMELLVFHQWKLKTTILLEQCISLLLTV